MRMALKMNFQREGWLVDVAEGSSEALRKLERFWTGMVNYGGG